jgi:hypothetical protein
VVARRQKAVEICLQLVGDLHGIHIKKPTSIGWSVVM